MDCNFPTVGVKRTKWGEETPAEEDKKHIVKAAKMDIKKHFDTGIVKPRLSLDSKRVITYTFFSKAYPLVN